MRRRLLLSLGAGSLLAGCGFRLRGAPSFAFQSLYLQAPGTSLTEELRRYLVSASNLRLVEPPAAPDQAEVVLELYNEQRARVVVGRGASGQVRELELRVAVKFRLRSARGVELIPETEIEQRRDISYNETQVLSKEQEEALLYRDMDGAIARQLLRRLAAVKQA